MALPGGIGIGADDLDALVGIVHAHAIAEPFQRLAHEVDELGGAGGAVAVAEHEIRPVDAAPLRRVRSTDRGHRMAVDLPDLYDAAVQRVERLVQPLVNGTVLSFAPVAPPGNTPTAIVHLEVRRP